jgi:hypothetical protein
MTLAEQYNELVARLETENQRQNNPLGLPIGYHKVIAANGEPMGFGFYCPKCKLHHVVNAPKQIKHCNGVVSRFPTGLFTFFKLMGMKDHKLQRRWL